MAILAGSPMEAGPQEGVETIKPYDLVYMDGQNQNVSELKAIVRRWRRPP